MKSLQNLIFAFFFLLPLQMFGKSIHINSIKDVEIERLLEVADKNTLVLIDVDKTIVMPKSAMFLPRSPYRNLIETMVKNSESSSYYNGALANWYSQRKIELVEEDWPKLIAKFQSKGAIVLGLSELNKAIYVLFKDPEVWKYNELIALGINFNNKIGNKELFKIADLRFKASVFYQGIIFTGPFTKAETVVDFLKVSTLMPRKIIVFESNKNYIKQIEYAFRRFDIDWYGVNYLPLNVIDKKLDAKLAEFQQEILLTQGKWLEDAEAAKLLNKVNE